MRIMLIRPPIYSKNLRYPAGPRFGLPLGILYLAAAIEQENIEVSLYDALIDFDLNNPAKNDDGSFHIGASWNTIIKKVKDRCPDIVGITNPFSDFFSLAIRTAIEIKKRFPGIVTVAGGPHASGAPESFFQSGMGIDYVVRGEAEKSFLRLIDALRNNRPLSSVPGLTWRDGGVMRSNAMAGFIGDLDSIPFPAYHLIENMERYFYFTKTGFPSRFMFEYPGSEREVSLITSRGCPFHCVFCGNHIHMGRRWRYHSADYVLRHMELLIARYGVRHFHIEDDNITLNKKRFELILDGIISRKWNITWDTPNGVRAEGLTEELLVKAKTSGCTYMIIGIESGNQKVLDTIIKKTLDLGEVRAAARICKKTELDLHGFYIVGFPGETVREIQDTFRFALDLLKTNSVIPHLCLARPLAGTELHKLCQKGNYLTDTIEPNIGSGIRNEVFPRRMIATGEFTPELLERLTAHFNLKAMRIIVGQSVVWLLLHPLVMPIVVKKFVLDLRFGLGNAVKRIFFGGMLYKNNFLRWEAVRSQKKNHLY
jgi:radical SAM superfamily enzyme YgiQ (UPF0313 family)